MNNPLPQSNVLAAIGSAVVVSVICTWTISTHFQSQNEREFDRVHTRLDTIVSKITARIEPLSTPADSVWEMPAAPDLPEEMEGP